MQTTKKNKKRMMMKEYNKFTGSTVFLRDGDDVNRALRKFKNKIEDSGKLKDLQKKEFYEKPTTQRKRKKAAAVARWAKKVRDQQLPKKMY
jgi:small subunit ribosomal protein S21